MTNYVEILYCLENNVCVLRTHLKNLALGKPYEEMHEFCDFTLEEQNEVQVAKGVQPSAPNEFKPVIKKNVSYIVAGKVCINFLAAGRSPPQL